MVTLRRCPFTVQTVWRKGTLDITPAARHKNPLTLVKPYFYYKSQQK
jgi:hypothetical protein